MNRRHFRRVGMIGALALALVLSGCGGSKKGNNGYGLAPLTHTHVSPAVHTRAS